MICPTKGLIHQTRKEFVDYGHDTHDVSIFMSGYSSDVSKSICISTWQSAYKLNEKWFANFDVIICDEAHLATAQSIRGLMEKLKKCKYRFGLTGTLDDSKTHKLILEGLFGSVVKVTSTNELISKKTLADLDIKCIILKHPVEATEKLQRVSYQSEIEYLIECEARNKFISNLALSLKGNTLVLYQYVANHGQILFNTINTLSGEEKKNIYFIHGGVEAEERDTLRAIVDSQTDSIIVASLGTFSTGINIKNIHNIIFSSPSKSKIRVLQSIGRGLRVSDTKTECVLFDISDDLRYDDNQFNYTLKHFMERLKIYIQEKFPYKIYKVDMKKGS